MNISQRQATIFVLGFQWITLIILWLGQLFTKQSDASLTLGAGIAVLIYSGMLFAYIRGWEYARHTSVVLITLIVAIFLPEPFVTTYAPFLLLLGPILALVLLTPLWVIASAVATIGVLLLRAGGVGVYANFSTLLNYSMLIAGLAVSRVITETARTQAEQAEATRDQLVNIVEASNDAVLSKTLDGIITSWNRGAERMYGYSAKEAIGQSISLIIPSDRPNELKEILKRIQRGEHVEHYETVRVRKDGTRVDISITISPLNDPSGKIIGASTIARDITERKQAEAALQKIHDELELEFQQRTKDLSETTALLETMLEYIPDQIYFKDVESRFIRNSRSQAKALGLSDPSHVVGKTDFDFFPHAQRSFDEEQKIIRTGKPLVDFEEWVVWPDGQEMWVSTTKLPLRDKKNNIIGTFGISRDITARKHAEEELLKSNIQLEAANKELEAFSYSVSHDLRAPLRTIDGFSQAVMEDYGELLPEQAREDLARVRKAAQRMSQLIDDLLNLSRLTRAPMKLETVNLSKLARDIMEELKRTQPGRNVNFTCAPDLKAYGDSHLLEVVLENLLNNAWKFTSKREQAEIELGAKHENNERIYFIRDNGAGFDMTYVNKLFGAFQRLHAMTDFSGTGIGLATVQRIINRHAGRIWAEAEVNNGATFFFTLPAMKHIKPMKTTKQKDSLNDQAKGII